MGRHGDSGPSVAGRVWSDWRVDTKAVVTPKTEWGLVMKRLGVQAKASLGEVWGQTGTITLTQGKRRR